MKSRSASGQRRRSTSAVRRSQPAQPTARSRDEEVARLLGIGATLVEDHRKADGAGWVTLADPEGNEFCVERSARERGLKEPGGVEG